MRRKVNETGWGKSHNGNKAKTQIIERHKTKVKQHKVKKNGTALKSNYKARNGAMIGNYSGAGASGWDNGNTNG